MWPQWGGQEQHIGLCQQRVESAAIAPRAPLQHSPGRVLSSCARRAGSASLPLPAPQLGCSNMDSHFIQRLECCRSNTTTTLQSPAPATTDHITSCLPTAPLRRRQPARCTAAPPQPGPAAAAARRAPPAPPSAAPAAAGGGSGAVQSARLLRTGGGRSAAAARAAPTIPAAPIHHCRWPAGGQRCTPGAHALC